MQNLPLLLTTVHSVKSKGKISQNFEAFSECMNFNTTSFKLWLHCDYHIHWPDIGIFFNNNRCKKTVHEKFENIFLNKTENKTWNVGCLFFPAPAFKREFYVNMLVSIDPILNMCSIKSTNI